MIRNGWIRDNEGNWYPLDRIRWIHVIEGKIIARIDSIVEGCLIDLIIYEAY